MSLRVYGERLVTADFAGTIPRVYVSVTFNKNFVLKAVRTWVIIYNNPTFTALQLRVYSNKNGAPAQLIHTFDKQWSLAEITDYDYALKEIYFDVTLPRFFKDEDVYHFALWATDYTGDGSSHVAWKRGYHDPNAVLSVVPNTANLLHVPPNMAFIGADL